MIKVHFKGAVIECETDLVCRQVLEQIAKIEDDRPFKYHFVKRAEFDHSGRTVKHFDPLLGYCVCDHCTKLPISLTTRELHVGPLTARSLKVGDRFKFVMPPPGWSSGKLIVVDQIPGSALPEGWDFFDIRILDNYVELLDEKPWAYTIGSSIPPGEYTAKLCQHCGVVLIKGPTAMDLERYERGVCGGCQ